jgi:hypothetical protein
MTLTDMALRSTLRLNPIKKNLGSDLNRSFHTSCGLATEATKPFSRPDLNRSFHTSCGLATAATKPFSRPGFKPQLSHFVWFGDRSNEALFTPRI